MFFQPFHSVDKKLFWRPKPKSSYTMMHPEGDIIEYKINSFGFRGDDFSLRKQNGNIRIICAGDSSTFGFNVNYIDSYPERLKEILNIGNSNQYEVINAGVIGYSSFQGKIYFEQYLRKFKPDILIISYGINDSMTESISDADKKLGNVLILETQRVLNDSSLYKILCEIIHKIKRGMKLKNPAPRYVPLLPKASLNEYEENLERIISLCNDDKIILIYLPISVPIPYKEVMKNVASKNQVGFIDTEDIFKKYSCEYIKNGLKPYKDFPVDNVYFSSLDPALKTKFGSEEMVKLREWNYFFIDAYHPSPCGHQIISEELYKYLIEQNILTRK